MRQHQRHQLSRVKVEDRRRVTFYAAVFDTETVINERDQAGQLVSYREIIRPGAFAASLAAGDEVLATIDHDPARTWARRSDGTLVVQEDPHGLFCSAWVPDGEFGDRILADVEAGRLDGCSFMFLPQQDRRAGQLVERLAVRLADVCLTGSPAYPGTEVHLRTDLRMRQLLARLRLVKVRGRMTR